MMNKLVILLFSILIFKNTYAQKKGIYKGLYPIQAIYPVTDERDTVIDGKKNTILIIDTTQQYGEKKLILFKNSKFSFEYTGGCYAFSPNQQRRSCKGQYKVTRDTLSLTSTYKQSDFYSVTEELIDTIPSGKIMIITNHPKIQLRPGTGFTWLDLQLNDTLIGDFKINDTIYCKTNEVKRLFFHICTPQEMEWSYVPQNTKTNYFNVTLTRHINGENIFVSQEKFLIRKKKLIFISGSNYLNVKDGLYKKD